MYKYAEKNAITLNTLNKRRKTVTLERRVHSMTTLVTELRPINIVNK